MLKSIKLNFKFFYKIENGVKYEYESAAII